jgi:hypothetical protein
MRSQTLRSEKVEKRKTMRKRNAGTTLLHQGMVEVAVTRGLTGPPGEYLVSKWEKYSSPSSRVGRELNRPDESYTRILRVISQYPLLVRCFLWEIQVSPSPSAIVFPTLSSASAR